MEAMWTRFFPAVRKVRETLSSGELGEPLCVQADFGFEGPADENHRLWDPAQAGGVMLDIGCYLVQAATMVFGPSAPDLVACTGRLSARGVDSEGVLSLTWTGKGSASLLCTLHANMPEQTLICCSKGYIRLHGPAHCPTRVTVAKGESRGNFAEETFDFELPECPAGLACNYPHSEGMLYQVQAVEECLRAGKLESDEFPLEESLSVVRVMDTYREQVGVVYPFEQ